MKAKFYIFAVIIGMAAVFSGCKDDPIPPTIVIKPTSGIVEGAATLNAEITNPDSDAITSCGFYYNTSSDMNNPEVVNATLDGSRFSAEIFNLESCKTYYYLAFARNNAGLTESEIKSFTTAGTLNGHGWVDLGLPSGIKWATCNVGSNTPEGYGDFFAWGETFPKKTYGWENYMYAEGTWEAPRLTKYCNSSSYGNNGFTDNLTTLEASDDAATANWGSGWRMPTKAEMQELFDNCTYELTTQNGVNGRLYIGPNDNTIFLPYGKQYGLGHYWSGSLYTKIPDRAWGYVASEYSDEYGDEYRFRERSVRAVCQ